MTSEKATVLLDALEGFNEVSVALHWEVVRCGDELNKLKTIFENNPNPTPQQLEESQFWLRSFTRTFFAWVDGVSYKLRQLALGFHESDQLRLPVGEQVLLLEKRYFWDKGKVRSKDAHNKAAHNLPIAFTLFPRAFGVDFKLAIEDHRYRSFQEALKLRHAITHPKEGKDLRLLPESNKQLSEAVAWFCAEAQRMRDLCHNAVDPNLWAEWTQRRG